MEINFVIFLISTGIFYFIFFFYPKIVNQQQIDNRLLYLKQYKISNMSENAEEEIMAPGVINKLLRRIFEFFKKFNSAEMINLQYQLHRSGWHSKKSVAIFILLKFFLSATTTLVALIILMSQSIYLTPTSFWLVTIIAVLSGFQVPDYLLNFFIKRRRAILEEGIPDMVDILVICTDAGLGLDATLERVSRELRTINKPLSEELALTVLELSFSANRRHALHNLSNRLNIKGITTLISIFIQSEQYGTTLSQTLKSYASEARQERILTAEAKAARLPAVLTLPLIVFIMPCLFIILLTPLLLKLRS